MTDRHCGYVVTLDRDVREDDAEIILNAIRMVKGVVAVEPVVVGPDQMIAEARVRNELTQKIYEALRLPLTRS